MRIFIFIFFIVSVTVTNPVSIWAQMTAEEEADYKEIMLSEARKLNRVFEKMASAKELGDAVDPSPYCDVLSNFFSKETDQIFHQFEGYDNPNGYKLCNFFLELMGQPYDDVIINWKILTDSISIGNKIWTIDGLGTWRDCWLVFREAYYGYQNALQAYGNSAYKTIYFRISEELNRSGDTIKIVKATGIRSTKAKEYPPSTDLDSDRDGIPNLRDDCPYKKGDLKCNGCPCADQDGDGVFDFEDRCIDEPGPPNCEGCPCQKDSDEDGFPDDIDLCPYQAGSQEYCGCPPNSKQLPSRLTTLVPSWGNYKLDRPGNPHWIWAGLVLTSYTISGYYYFEYRDAYPNCCAIPPENGDVNGWTKYRNAKLARQNALTFAGVGTGIWIANIIQSNRQFSLQKKVRGCNPKKFEQKLIDLNLGILTPSSHPALPGQGALPEMPLVTLSLEF